MKIAIIVEGATEKAFLPALRRYLAARPEVLRMPRLRAVVSNGRISKGEKLRRDVEALLRDHEYVIALTDIYTGQGDFTNAADAKAKMGQWVGQNERFFPHAAQHDFEAWLLPYWDRVQARAGRQAPRPAGAPEQVNHQNPPAHRIQDLFRLGGRKYNKVVDGAKVLENVDLQVAADQCPELRAFLATVVSLAQRNA